MRLIIFAIGVLLAVGTRAQLKVGIQAGYNTSGWDYTGHTNSTGYVTETEGLGGFQGGVLTELGLSNKLALRTSLLYIRKGTQLNTHYRPHTGNRTIKVSYLELPVTVSYHVDYNKFRFGLGAGLYGGLALSGKHKGTLYSTPIGGTTTSQQFSNDIKIGSTGGELVPSFSDAFALDRYDYGYTVLSSIEFNRMLLLNVSYTAGLRDLLSDGYAWSYNENFRNRTVSISLGYLILKGKQYGRTPIRE
jgi:hypothetical protein